MDRKLRTRARIKAYGISRDPLEAPLLLKKLDCLQVKTGEVVPYGNLPQDSSV